MAWAPMKMPSDATVATRRTRRDPPALDGDGRGPRDRDAGHALPPGGRGFHGCSCRTSRGRHAALPGVAQDEPRRQRVRDQEDGGVGEGDVGVRREVGNEEQRHADHAHERDGDRDHQPPRDPERERALTGAGSGPGDGRGGADGERVRRRAGCWGARGTRVKQRPHQSAPAGILESHASQRSRSELPPDSTTGGIGETGADLLRAQVGGWPSEVRGTDWNPISVWVSSQKGGVLVPPHRQSLRRRPRESAFRASQSMSYSLPSASNRRIRP